MAERGGRVCVLGSANVDTVVRVERRPLPGETVRGLGRDRFAGGKGLNQAVAAARMGATVDFRARVGADGEADFLARRLAADGLDLSGVLRTSAPTGTADITVDAAGENTIVFCGGANDEFTGLSAADGAAIATADVLLLQGEVPVPVLVEAAGLGRTVVLTPAPVRAFPAALLDAVDVLVPNEHEAAELTGERDPATAARALSTGGRSVLVTVGERGVELAADGRSLGRVPAVPVSTVDTTGAGDTFAGALGALLAEGAALPEAARVAAAAAALSVTRAGAGGMPHRHEVTELLAATTIVHG
ncbi:ribokinase [Saccharopolyspora gregorii]|uniref:ribokinase n=1 Tax=Saccharopolyspora gregorii TaxID=33914 RepID=UPI0021ABB70B|nr:ribokinase [Saccharopolyspora gregorii]